MKKKITIVLASIAIVLGTVLILNSNYVKVKADPGFDSSFDSGGSSSFDSGSSYSSSDGGSGEFSAGSFIAFVVIFVFVIYIFYSSERSSSSTNNKALSDEVIHEKLGNEFDIEHFKKYVFDVYNKVCIAWMNNDSASLKEYLTNEMYNMYKTQLLTLSSKKQQNVMEDIVHLETKIHEIKVLEKSVEIVTILHVTCKDYIINTQTNKVLRGNKNKTNDYTYQVTFVSDKGAEGIKHCPSCGAEVGDNNTSVCPYCRKIIVKKSTKFVMSQKQMLIQK